LSLSTNIWNGSVWNGGPWEVSGWTPTDIPKYEANALVRFYNATDGENWTTPWDFSTATTADELYGVTVSGGHVTELDLNKLYSHWQNLLNCILLIIYHYTGTLQTTGN